MAKNVTQTAKFKASDEPAGTYSKSARAQRQARKAACMCRFGCDTCDPPPKGWGWN